MRVDALKKLQVRKVIDRLRPKVACVIMLDGGHEMLYSGAYSDRVLLSPDGRRVYQWDGEELDEHGRRVFR